VDLLPKLKLEMVTPSARKDEVIGALVEAVRTGPLEMARSLSPRLWKPSGSATITRRIGLVGFAGPRNPQRAARWKAPTAGFGRPRPSFARFDRLKRLFHGPGPPGREVVKQSFRGFLHLQRLRRRKQRGALCQRAGHLRLRVQRARAGADPLAIAGTFGQSFPLVEFPKLKSIRALGMTDKQGYARLLADKFDYTNTYYDREPRFDFTESHPGLGGAYDFILSADVLEHVAPPVGRAIGEICRLLKPHGFLAATVPCAPGGEMRSIFPICTNIASCHWEIRRCSSIAAGMADWRSAKT